MFGKESYQGNSEGQSYKEEELKADKLSKFLSGYQNWFPERDIKLVNLARIYGISVFENDIEKYNKDYKVTSFSVRKSGGDVVCVDSSLDSSEKRQLAIEEIGHVLLGEIEENIYHFTCGNNNKEKTVNERACARFAREVIMPEKEFIYLYAEFGIFNNYIAEHFGVEKDLVKKRVKDLKLPYIN